MATATNFVTVEEYRAAPSNPTPSTSLAKSRSEPSENDHSAWQEAISAWFRQQAQAGQIRVRPELRVQVAPDCFLVPDVTLLDRNRPIEQIVTHPPVAVIEILSPADSIRRVMTKCGRYEQMGIRTILLIDPAGPKYRYVAGRLEPLDARAFDLPGSLARFDLDEIEKLLD